MSDEKVCLFASAKQHRLFSKQSAKGAASHSGDRLALSSARSLESSLSCHAQQGLNTRAASPAPQKGTGTGVTWRSSAGPKAARVTPGGLLEPSWKKPFEVTCKVQGYSWFETEDSRETDLVLMKEVGRPLLLLAGWARKPNLGPSSWCAIYRVSSRSLVPLSPTFFVSTTQV